MYSYLDVIGSDLFSSSDSGEDGGLNLLVEVSKYHRCLTKIKVETYLLVGDIDS
jgi:hypothetical protein